ncbi:hypothetical protein AB4Y30_08510 [Ornithinibacillus sp. 4-3]|uniref:Lipoprotein n=1 Tax=Ornithinibacillus sp. 4-3 TaxID=3231488 RepID=A0AB39HXB0_9BACI
MSLKRLGFVISGITILLILSACQGGNDPSPDEIDVSQPEYELDEEQQTEAGESNNDGAASGEGEEDTDSEGTSNNNIKQKDYSSEQEAIDAIDNYEVVEQTNIELGYGIKALSEGATGHQYISWNEGKWMIRVNAPTDPEYATGNYENGEELARTVVDYLETNYLPAPDQRGVIDINDFGDHPETVIRWQQGNSVYEIDESTDNPINALQIAVDSAS